MFFIKLLFQLIGPILFFCFFLFMELLIIYLAIQGINEGSIFHFLWFTTLSLIFVFGVWTLFKVVVDEYKTIRRNLFLDTYIFPQKLSKILSEKYPHLKKNEIEEVLETMIFFSRPAIKQGNFYIYMPSHVVDFAFKTFFDMNESTFFSKKLLYTDNKYRRILPKNTTSSSKEFITVLLAAQHEESINFIISKMWCYCCKKEDIDPFFPLSFPSFFTLDKRLKIPSGFIFELDETLFRETLPISEAPTLNTLEDEIKNIENIDCLAKRIQYYLGSYDYCHKYQKGDLEDLFKLIDKNQSLAHAIYGQYSDVTLFKMTVLNNSAPPENPGCSSGASI